MTKGDLLDNPRTIKIADLDTIVSEFKTDLKSDRFSLDPIPH